MKFRQLITIVFSVFFIVSCSKSLKVIKGVPSEFEKKNFIYNLPKNEIRLVLELESVETKSPIFTHKDYGKEFENQMKDLDNKLFKAYKNGKSFKLSKISISEQAVPDESKLYSIIVENPRWYEIFSKLDYSIEMNDAGILNKSTYTYDNYTSDFTADVLTGLIQYYFKPLGGGGSGSKKPPISKNDAQIVLKETINKINKLENRRNAIICGEVSNLDRKLIDLELKVIDKELLKMYGILKGKKLPTKKNVLILPYTPGTTLDFYFSKRSGLSLSTIPKAEKYTVNTVQYENFSSADLAKYTKNMISTNAKGLAYNKPLLCDIQVTKDSELIASKVTYIPQLGTVGYLDPKGLNHLSSSLTLDPKTGALLKAGTKSSLLADPSKYGSGIAEAIKGIEKKEESAPTPEIDKQISELEKKFRLLELQTKIDSLESLQIDP